MSRPVFLLLRCAALCGWDEIPSTLKLCPAKPQRDLVLGAPAPQLLGLSQLGSVPSSPCSRGCFCSGIWDRMAKGSRAGPKSDCSERGKPDADRRTWRKSSGRGRRSAYVRQSRERCSEVSGLSQHEDKAGWLVSQDTSCARSWGYSGSGGKVCHCCKHGVSMKALNQTVLRVSAVAVLLHGSQ